LTARQKERAGSEKPTALAPTADATSQAEGLRVLLSIAVGRAEDLLDEIALRDEEALTGPIELVQEPGVTSVPLTEPTRAQTHQPPRVRTVGSGRHAASIPPLHRRGLRFVIFSAIGGFVFLLGLGLQVVLTGGFHVLPVVSYLIQAVVSVEVSFLLNRWLTWRDRDTPFWPAFVRFNAQKVVTIALNLALYAGLLRLGINYLVANVALTVLFTVVNFVAGDRLVFVPRRARIVQPAAPAVRRVVTERLARSVSVVIPCRDNERTIGAAVQSLLDQDYPGLSEIILVGSPEDHTWDGLAGLDDPRLTIWEMETPPGLRDANFKRDAAIRKASGDLIALVDSDVVLPPDWISRAVATMEDSGESCVTGGLKSAHDSFWGRYTDSTWIGAKTPRIAESYTVTSADFGVHGRKPPITANALVTRELYDQCPIEPSWSHGSYEDYEWFWRVTKAGYGIFVCRELFGWHHHRRGLRALAKEYRRSSRGCAYFIRAHRDCPLSRRRLRQVIILPLAALAAAIVAAAAAATGHGIAVAAAVLGCAAVLAVHQVARSRSLESLAYPLAGLALGMVYTAGLATNLIQSGSATATSPITPSPAGEPQTRQSERRPRRLLLYPLIAICAVQTALSLTLVWSNTAYVDEADYLSAGRLEIAHWLHKTSWPSTFAYEHFSGSPAIYPPLGALAAGVGGVAGARILSLVFMLAATILLYLTASRLIGRTGALFAASLWALSEPVIRMAFATFDPLSVLLTALSSWLIVQAGCRRHRGELVAAAAVTLAFANVTSYSGIIIDPLVIAFATLVWLRSMGKQQSLSCVAWLTGTWALSFGLLMTFSHSWAGFLSTVLVRSAPGNLGASSVLSSIWAYSGLIISFAVVGAIVCHQSDRKDRAALLMVLCFAPFIVPVVQLNDQTVSSIDIKLAYGIWFVAIPAGYACAKFIRWLPGARRSLAAVCCAVALIYPAVISWQSAWQRYHAWPNASGFISAFEPIAARSQGLIYLPGREMNIAEFYTPQTYAWTRWSGALSLDPVTVSKTYYSAQLHSHNYGVIVLFYSTTFSSWKLPQDVLLSQNDSYAYRKLLDAVGDNSGEPGLSALTLALETDRQYRLATTGHYDTSNISGTHDYGIYAIWQKVET
jgi:putative flippase GtrA/glycosyltransferase involved in cell wall biosynthesis